MLYMVSLLPCCLLPLTIYVALGMSTFEVYIQAAGAAHATFTKARALSWQLSQSCCGHI